MKKCPKCGKTYDDSWKICLTCRAPLTKNLSTKPSGKPKNKPKRKNPILYSVIIFLTMYACVLFIFLLVVMAGSGVSTGMDSSYDSAYNFLFRLICWPIVLLKIYPYISAYGQEIAVCVAALGWGLLGFLLGVVIKIGLAFVFRRNSRDTTLS